MLDGRGWPWSRAADSSRVSRRAARSSSLRLQAAQTLAGARCERGPRSYPFVSTSLLSTWRSVDAPTFSSLPLSC